MNRICPLPENEDYPLVRIGILLFESFDALDVVGPH